MAQAGWKFAEPPNQGVFTTRQVWQEGHVLALVSHDLEGDWQFLHDEEADGDEELRDVDDAMIVCLEDVVTRFPDVEPLADLPIGWIAHRVDQHQPWVREPRPADWPS